MSSKKRQNGTKSTSIDANYLKERRKWYKILADEGFEEQEDINLKYYDDFPPLKQTSYNAGQKLLHAKENATEEYYQVAQEWASKLPKNSVEWSVWFQHSTGATIPEIKRRRKSRRQTPLTTDQIKKLLVKVRAKMIEWWETEAKKEQDEP